MNKSYANGLLTLKWWYWHLVPLLVVLFTFTLPLLHFKKSRIYNEQMAVLQGIIILFALVIYRKDLWLHLFKSNIDRVIIILFLAFGFISTLQSEFFLYSLERYISVIIWFIYLGLLVFLLQKAYLSTMTLVWSIVASSLIPIFQYVSLLMNLGIETAPYAIHKNIEYYSHLRHFGYHLTIVFMLSFYVLFEGQKNNKKVYLWIGLFLIIVNSLALFWSGSRQGGIIIMAFTIAMLPIIYHLKSVKKIVITLSILTAFFILLFLVFKDLAFIKRLISTFQDTTNLTQLLSGRNILWSNSLTLLNDHWLFGIGPETFAQKSTLYGSVHPHSVIIQLLLSWGVVGLSLFSIIIFRLFKHSIYSLKLSHTVLKKENKLILIMILIALSINSLIDGIFYHVLPLTYFMTVASVLMATFNQKHESV